MKPPKYTQGVDAKAYTKEYYETHCEGYKEFNESRGKRISNRLQYAINIADLQPGMFVVDIGCGRGELVRYLAANGIYTWGIDYSEIAIDIARELINQEDASLRAFTGFQLASATFIPIKSNSVDVVFMLDIVEHLYPEELSTALNEVNRILKPGGKLIVHTMPNLWYYRFGYPIYRLIERTRGNHLPANPRERFNYSHVHVNEQTPHTLANVLSKYFKYRVWLHTTQNYHYERNPLIRFGMKFFSTIYPFKLIFCNDIFAIAICQK